MDLTTIATDLGYAKQYYLKKMDDILSIMQSGCGDTSPVKPLKRIIRALEWRVDASINDNTTSALYACMMQIIGSFNQPYAIDPNVMIPNTTIIVEGTGRALKVIMDPSSSNLSKGYLNETYPYPEYQEGDIVYVPEAYLQYTKLQNNSNSEWNEQPLSIIS